jgi:ribonuclease PH
MTSTASRPSGRTADALRPVSFELGVNKHAEGSCLVKFGDTHVLCMASVEETVPSWLRGGGKGWVTAEYGMLPRATNTRMAREAAKGKQSGRTQEIQRLIGRALRAVTNLRGFGEIQIRVDCDVIQADGGTRTASVTGGYLALYQAFATMKRHGAISEIPFQDSVAAISCGLFRETPVLDLDYPEDSTAQADANFVLTGTGKIVEIQGTAEDHPFSEGEFHALLTLAKKGIRDLTAMQTEALAKAGL